MGAQTGEEEHEAESNGKEPTASTKPPPGLTPVSSSSDIPKAAQETADAGGDESEEKAEAEAAGSSAEEPKEGSAPAAEAEPAGSAPPKPEGEEEAKEEKEGLAAPATPSVEEASPAKDAKAEEADDEAAEEEAAEGGDAEGEGGKARKNGKGRVFFHFSEVQDEVSLGLSDEVEFSLYRNPKNKELNARHVVRTKACPPARPPCAPFRLSSSLPVLTCICEPWYIHHIMFSAC